MSYTLQYGQVTEYIPYLLAGAWVTLQIAFLAFLGGNLIGLVGATALTFGGRISRRVASAYTTFFTNTPGLVQIYFLYYALADFGILFEPYEAVLIGMTLNGGAYMTQIHRGGFLSVHQQELDAAAAMGMTLSQSVRYVIVPHIAKVLFAPLSNKFILVVLGSAVAGIFGVEELTGRTITVNAETFRAIELFTITSVIYVVLTLIATAVLAGLGRYYFRVKAKIF